MSAAAFQGKKDRHLNVMSSSGISHWNLPDMCECVSEAYELVEQGHLANEDFEAVMFANPLRLHAGMNPDFFKGTGLGSEVEKLKPGGKLN